MASVTRSSRRGPGEVPVPLQTSFLCLGLVGGSGVEPCTDRHCLCRPLLAQVGPFLPLMLWVLLISMPLPGSGWGSPRGCVREADLHLRQALSLTGKEGVLGRRRSLLVP